MFIIYCLFSSQDHSSRMDSIIVRRRFFDTIPKLQNFNEEILVFGYVQVQEYANKKFWLDERDER